MFTLTLPAGFGSIPIIETLWFPTHTLPKLVKFLHRNQEPGDVFFTDEKLVLRTMENCVELAA